MWLWILIGLSIITKVHGYSSGNFPQSCESMRPEHGDGAGYLPQNTEPPFEVTYHRGKEGEPITVSLQRKSTTTFRGFMLEARRTDNGDRVGNFIILNSGTTRLLACSGKQGSAVSHKHNQQKRLIQVNWTAPEAELDVTFRATFLQTYSTFWERVDGTLYTPPTTTQPSTTASTTTSTTEPSTTTSTTEPSTTTSTTKPSTTTSTTEPSTTTSTTKPSTTTSTTEPSTTTSTTSRTTQDPTKTDNQNLKQGATVAITWDIFFAGLTTELPVVMMIFTNFPTHHLNKKSKIACCVLCAAAEISALTLLCLGDSFEVTLVALMCVVIGINLIKLVIVSLPIGPSHELKEICDHFVKVCSIVHKILATAAIFVVLMEIDKKLQNVMIAYTVWISVLVIWIFVFSTCGKAILRRGQKGTGKSWKQQRQKKKLTAATVAVIVVSVILIVGSMSFAFVAQPVIKEEMF